MTAGERGITHPVRVRDADDPRVADYTRLTDMDLRLRHESAAGVFMAEGMLVLERVLAAGMDILSVLTAEKWLERLEMLPITSPVYIADEQLLRSITGYSVHRGALAVVRRPPTHSVDTVLAMPGDVLVLEGLVDPTNVGLAIRSAVSQGVGLAILSPDCADPLYRRAVKSSMGAVLRCRWARSDDWAMSLEALRATRAVIALDPQGDEDVDAACRRHRDEEVALVLGSEGPGLTSMVLQVASGRARIPMAAEGDSLNVAAAAAVACFARMRTRTMPE